MKKLVGLINLLFGIIEITVSVYILFIIPKVLKMYENLNVDLPHNFTNAYLYFAFLILLGLVNSIIGLGNFGVLFKNKSDLVYKIGIFLVILSSLVVGVVVSAMLITV